MNNPKLIRLYGILSALVIVGFSVYILLDTFVIVRKIDVNTGENPSYYVRETTAAEPVTAESQTDLTSEDTTESLTKDETTSIETTPPETTTEEETTTEAPQKSVTIRSDRAENTDIHIAEIWVTDAMDLKSAFAYDSYGKNIRQKVRDISSEHGAWVSINGDYYGARDTGYVLRNGVLYRSDVAGPNREDLVIYYDGTWELIREAEISAEELWQNGAWQVLSFGPGLVNQGEVLVGVDAKVDIESANNPRTAIGMIEPNHYVMVVVDGRTNTNGGMSVYQLAVYMQSLGCQIAYNLDGGGSSTMWYEGDVISYPIAADFGVYCERYVSDILYIPTGE